METPDLKKISFTQLEDQMSRRLNRYIKFYPRYVTPMGSNGSSGKPYMEIKTYDLKQETGIMSGIYKSLHVASFNGGLSENNEKYLMQIHFEFEYNAGGSNGAHICFACYDFDTKEWTTYE